MDEVGRQPIVAHNDPSPARDRVLRIYEQRHEPLNILVSLPSLDAIKRAVEHGPGRGDPARGGARWPSCRGANWSPSPCRNCSCAAAAAGVPQGGRPLARRARVPARRRRTWRADRSGSTARPVERRSGSQRGLEPADVRAAGRRPRATASKSAVRGAVASQVPGEKASRAGSRHGAGGHDDRAAPHRQRRQVDGDASRRGSRSTGAISALDVVRPHASRTARRGPSRCRRRSPRTTRRRSRLMPQRAMRLRRVLARRAAAEVAVHEQHGRARAARVVERVRAARGRAGPAVVLEDVRLEAVEAHRAQEARRHDAVGVDVVAAQRRRARPLMVIDASRAPAASAARRSPRPPRRPPPPSPGSSAACARSDCPAGP